MGMTYAEITLRNVADQVFAQKGSIDEKDIRTVTVTAVVDTGSMNLVITEDVFQKLGLSVVGEKVARIANGQRVTGKVTEPVEIRWKDRFWTVNSLVIPGAEKILLGAIPLEGMDLMVNPVTQELVGVHGDEIEYITY